MRIVIDTNVVISALCFPLSLPRKAFDIARRRATILTSDECFLEISSVLMREKFEQYIERSLRLEFIEQYRKIMHFIAIKERFEVCRDPKDDKFLELALNGQAEMIISGDNDLLEIDPFKGIRILKVNEFIEKI